MGWLGDGLGWVWDHTVGAVVGGATGFVWDQVVAGIVGWIVEAVAWFVGRVLSLLEESTRVNLHAEWFVGADGPYRKVLAIAAVLLLGFLFLGLLQGLLAGDPMAMLARMGRDLPLAVLGMVTTIALATKLLELSDELSRAVLRGGGDNAKQVLEVIGDASFFSGQTSFVIAVLGLFCILAALFVWVELVIRSALIYLLIAMSPLVFAAMVWPSTRGMLRRLSEIVMALIFSKVVIAIAFSVGAAALSGIDNAGHADAGFTGEVAASAGTLFSGAVIFCLAAFAPFVLLKLFPMAEAAVAAQGISRGPVRATQQVSSSAFYLERLADGHASFASNGSSNGSGGYHSPKSGFGSGPAGGSPSANGAGPDPGPADGPGSGGATAGAGGGGAGTAEGAAAA
ncbi:MAG: type IV secretion system protein, partial [Acidimicrobiia bacterium]